MHYAELMIHSVTVTVYMLYTCTVYWYNNCTLYTCMIDYVAVLILM